jgi:ABC-type Zn uptake system ZnuABC Zn-binding protein ZnuA
MLLRTTFSIVPVVMRRLVPLPLLLLALLLPACGGDDAAGAAGTTVVATTTQAADLARNVAGNRAATVGLIPANADPHAHEIRPRDVEALAEASLIVRSGGDLDEWLEEAVSAAGDPDAETLDLSEHVETHEGGHAHEGESGAEGEEEHAEDELDPHWWHDPRNAVRAVRAIERALSTADPEGAATYARNARTYIGRVEALDRRIADCMRGVPADDRKLVTTHDALGYFAERYDIEVIGAVIPSLSTRGQPSAGETARLVETIRAEGVRTVFTESSLLAEVEEAIARDAGARLGEPLYADTLGEEGSPEATYLGALAHNAEAMAAGFTGRAGACDLGA